MNTTMKAMSAVGLAAVLTMPALAAAQEGRGTQGAAGVRTEGARGGATAGAQSAGGAATDAEFVRFAAMSSMAEIELGKVAQQRASAMPVRNFGQQMVGDHTKATAELRQAAGATSLPASGELDPKHRQLRDRLMKLSGAEFDREYMSAMVEDHRLAVARFKQQASAGSGPLQNFAQKSLPVLQQHLDMAQQIQSQVATGTSRGTGHSGGAMPRQGQDPAQPPGGRQGQPPSQDGR